MTTSLHFIEKIKKFSYLKSVLALPTNKREKTNESLISYVEFFPQNVRNKN